MSDTTTAEAGELNWAKIKGLDRLCRQTELPVQVERHYEISSALGCACLLQKAFSPLCPCPETTSAETALLPAHFSCAKPQRLFSNDCGHFSFKCFGDS